MTTEEYQPQPPRPFVSRGGSGKRAGRQDDYYQRNRDAILAKRHEQSMKARADRKEPTVEEQRRSHERRSAAAKRRERELSSEAKAKKSKILDAGRAVQLQRYEAERRPWDAIKLRGNSASLIEIAEELGFGKSTPGHPVSRKRVRKALRDVDMPKGMRYELDRGVPFTRGSAVAFYKSLRQSPEEFSELIRPIHPIRARRIVIWFSSLAKNLIRVEARACIELRSRIAKKLLLQDTRRLGHDAYNRVEVLATLFPRCREEYQLLDATLPEIRAHLHSSGEAREDSIAAFVIERAQREKTDKSESRIFRDLIRWLPELMPVILKKRVAIAGEMVINRVALDVLAATIGAPAQIVRHALPADIQPASPEKMRELLRIHVSKAGRPATKRERDNQAVEMDARGVPQREIAMRLDPDGFKKDQKGTENKIARAIQRLKKAMKH